MLIQDTNTGTRLTSGQALTGRLTQDIPASQDFQINNPQSPATTQVITGGSSSTTTTVEDASLNQFTSASTLTVPNVQVTVPLNGYATGPASFTSSSTPTATVNTSGTVTPVAAGTANITINVPGLGTRIPSVTVVAAGGVSTTTFANFVSGSLGAHLTSQITALLTGLTPPTFSGSPPYAFNPLTNIFNTNGTRNTSLWFPGDLTCIPQSIETNGVLVTPRDMLLAFHFNGAAQIGEVISFRDNSNTVSTRTIVSARQLTSPVGDSDIYVATLNADVPSGITPATVMPSSFRSYEPQPQYQYWAPFTNQDRTLLVGSLTSTTSSDLFITQPVGGIVAPWYYPVRPGDSGSPGFHLINGKLVVLTQWHYEGAAGPIDADNISGINAAITANGSPYSLTVASLTGFNTY